MSLSEQITSDMKEAMKAKNSATLSTLRLLRSAIKNKAIDLRHDLSDDEVQAVVKSQVKQLKDSIESFKEGGRDEMVQDLQVELEVLSAYLPEEMGDEELESVVKGAVEASGASSKAEMGMAMGAAMKAVAGRADGNRVKTIVMKLLPSLALVLVGTFAHATSALAAIPLDSELGSMGFSADFMVMGLQALRVIILWFGIAAIVNILNGGFQYMTSSMRDASHEAAMSKITMGLFATVVVAATFSAITIILQQIG